VKKAALLVMKTSPGHKEPAWSINSA